MHIQVYIGAVSASIHVYPQCISSGLIQVSHPGHVLLQSLLTDFSESSVVEQEDLLQISFDKTGQYLEALKMLRNVRSDPSYHSISLISGLITGVTVFRYQLGIPRCCLFTSSPVGSAVANWD